MTTADRITALEAMCETLAGALEERMFLHYWRVEGMGIEQARIHARAHLSETLTQYRAMKEKNDG